MNVVGSLVIGAVAGLLSGLLGIGGGVIIVPALVYGLGFSQARATGTSLAVLLPPVGVAAVLEYWRHADVDFRAAMCMAAAVVVCSWLGARLALKLDARTLKMVFGLGMTALGLYMVFEAARQ